MSGDKPAGGRAERADGLSPLTGSTSAARLQQVRVPRVYMVIVDQIRRLIETGVLAPGERLPTERALAEELGVSRSSMREALTALEVMGIIDSKPGSGNYVVQILPADLAEVEYAGLIAEGGTNEILEARSLFEPGVAALAAERRTRSDLAKMRAAIDEMAELIARGADSWEPDWGFHRAIVVACQNPMMVAVCDLLTQRMAGRLWQVMRERNLATDPGRPSRYLQDHHDIFDAVRQRDPAAAGSRMRLHLARIVDDLADAAGGRESRADSGAAA
ncbi:MAG TPA: FadR/GntR family transcriptional regulator [Gaiellaceae bacterium]|nr:FadR/GntR family transcriptional regulator [Gaiellaceae bacterium]